ncbi:Na+/H+ antiporter NhaA [Gordonia jinhuaensis]|uniref:Na(+)/H(+) antiporter NhaA n=1 Tax=Gordonia jinhuaensis TaxID=1517702 RepID=A0A916T8I5_9ACTN|nr:Na(+)/H(+) antiporter NhaA [Gordonia jinhuaensis]
MSRGTTGSAFTRYLRTETTGGVVLVAATAIALLWANSPWSASFTTLRDAHIGPDIFGLNMSVAHWTADGLLAVFFFVAGLELKRELVIGDLSSRERAILPVLAAFGGVITPAVICLAVSWGSPGFERAWALPVATDIAFALGILSLAGSRVPVSARVFLLALAVVDDLIAIVIIAVVFSEGLNWPALGVAVLCCAVYAYAQHRRITAWWFYVPLAVVTWVAVFNSGIHATIAGVALALLTRVRADPGERDAPAVRLASRLQPVSSLICVPLFAVFAAGVSLDAHSLTAAFTERIALGAFLGLVIGKPLGIVIATVAAVRLGIARAPSGMQKQDLFAVSLLGGIGFTVSLLIADLALDDAGTEIATAAVLMASVLMSLLGAAALIRRGRVLDRMAADSDVGAPDLASTHEGPDETSKAYADIAVRSQDDEGDDADQQRPEGRPDTE